MAHFHMGSTTKQPKPLIACHECDLLQREIALPPGRVALCGRCGANCTVPPTASIDHTLAFTLAAAVFFILANAYPIIGLQIQATRNDTSLLSAVAHSLGIRGCRPSPLSCSSRPFWFLPSCWLS